MCIRNVLSPTDVLVGARVASKEKLISLLAEHAGTATGLSPRVIADELLKREQLGSTGVGDGIAIPHARIEGLAKPFGMLVVLAGSVGFESIDAEPVNLTFLLLLPAGQGASHLPTLASVTRRLRNQQVRAALRDAASASAAYAILCFGRRGF